MTKNSQKLFEVELLEQAIVPVNEQPFKIPNNWIWSKLSNLVVVSKLKFDDFHESQDIKYVGLEHIQKNGGIIGYESAETVKSLKNVFKNDDILYGKLRPYLNKHAIADFEGICSTDIMVFSSKAISSNKYINYYMDTDWFIENSISNSKGINLPRVSADIILNSHIPLPPFDEQQRIVERIESLFEKLDHAKALVQNALDSFENRKSAILHQAFSGELTKKWREENDININSWENKTLNEVMDVRDGTHDSPQYINQGYPLVTSKNLKNGSINFVDIKNISEEDYMKINLRSKVNVGDVLFAMIGTIGNPVVVIDEPTYAIKNMALFKNIDRINSFYVKYYLETKEVRDKMNREARGSTQRFVSLGYLRNFQIPVPSFQEQQEIVSVISDLFDNEEKANELYDVIEKIDLMKKAILTRAFRGDLGTNVPFEPCSLDL